MVVAKRIPGVLAPAGALARLGWLAQLGWLALPGGLALLGACSGSEPEAPRVGGRSASTTSNGSPTTERGERDASDPAAPADLLDEAHARGLDYVNRSGAASKPTILEANGAGVALLDLGNDGDLDVVFSQGLARLADLVAGPGADLEVFENDGSGRFRRAPGPGLAGWWTGLATGDVDGDGDADLVAGGFGDLVLLLQDATGKLVPARDSGLMPDERAARLVVGEARAKERPPLWATSLALFDADRDGRLDLYVGQYLDLDPVDPPLGALGEGATAVACKWKGIPVFCGPSGFPAQADRVLRGRGDGTFADATGAWLPNHVAGYTLGVLPFDADGDGDTDLFVANDSSPNLLLVNDGGLDGACRLADHAYAAGVALSADGRAQAGMGVAAGDVDRDGLVDFAVTNFSDEPTELYYGARVGFTRMTHRLGLLRETRALLSWGVHLADFDGDGFLELFSANGHVYPQADEPNTGTSYGQPAALWKITRSGLERHAPSAAGSLFAPAVSARGSAVGDLDGDGAPDLVLARIDARAGLGMNRMGRANHRLALRCLGPERASAQAPAGQTPADGSGQNTPADHSGRRTPADGLGTRAIVVVGSGADEHALLGEVETAAGYQSASSPWLHFGLGAEREYRAIRILWPSGRVDELPAGAADRRITVREGLGVVASESFR